MTFLDLRVAGAHSECCGPAVLEVLIEQRGMDIGTRAIESQEIINIALLHEAQLWAGAFLVKTVQEGGIGVEGS